MRGLIFVALLAAPLGACANLRTTVDTPECRHVLSPEGQALSICESPTRVTVADDPAPPDAETDAKLIDDPKFLASMMDHLPKPPAGAAAVRAGAPRDKTCERTPPGYITISSGDYLALVQAHEAGAHSDEPAPSPVWTRAGTARAPAN